MFLVARGDWDTEEVVDLKPPYNRRVSTIVMIVYDACIHVHVYTCTCGLFIYITHINDCVYN